MANNQRQDITTLLRQTRLLNRLERSFSNNVRREKNRFIVAQADNYKRTRQLSNDLLNEHEQKLKAIFRKHYNRIIRIFVGDITRSFPSAKAYHVYEKKRDLFSLLITEWVNEEGANKIKDVARTTFRDLRKVLIVGIAAEDPTPKIIKRLLGVRSLSPFRARTIARTETHNAAMFASKRSAQVIASDVGLALVKRWVPALDERTRFSHAAMRQHPAIDMDGKFRVGRASGGFDAMDRPGDPSGSAGNVIHCRCVLVYQEKT